MTVKASDDKLLVPLLHVLSFLWKNLKTITKTRNNESTKLKPFSVFACLVGLADRTGVLSCFRDKKVVVIGLSEMVFVV